MSKELDESNKKIFRLEETVKSKIFYLFLIILDQKVSVIDYLASVERRNEKLSSIINFIS